MKTWYTPQGAINRALYDMTEQPHLLIAGATGSGKSTLLHGIINALLYSAPPEKQLILIDPKRVELLPYQSLPHTIYRAVEPRDSYNTLMAVVNELERRFTRMEKARERTYQGSDIYIIIDELADLIHSNKKAFIPVLQKIARLGRAARIHLFAATQRPTRDIISGEIKCNIDARIALRTANRQDSRNIIDRPGAELLPRYGQGLYLTPELMTPTLITIPAINQYQIDSMLQFWQAQSRRSIFKRH